MIRQTRLYAAPSEAESIASRRRLKKKIEITLAVVAGRGKISGTREVTACVARKKQR